MKLIILFVLLLLSGVNSALTLRNVVVFGDSLSDNGNLYEYMQHQLPLSPPYYEGRFSNGPVWVERLVDSYFPSVPVQQHLLNYAFGGAGVSEEPQTEMLFTLKHEIDGYMLSHQDQADERSLFVVWIGANNYLGQLDDADQAVSDVIDGIKHSLQRLVDAGAKHILVFNLPDLGKSPFARVVHFEELLTKFTVDHNQKLLSVINELQLGNPSVQWLYYDVNSTLNSFLNDPQRYGFTNVDATCYESVADKGLSAQYLKYSMLNVVSKIKINSQQDHCEGYLFFDLIHPASRAHELMADSVHHLLDSAGISLQD